MTNEERAREMFARIGAIDPHFGTETVLEYVIEAIDAAEARGFNRSLDVDALHAKLEQARADGFAAALEAAAVCVEGIGYSAYKHSSREYAEAIRALAAPGEKKEVNPKCGIHTFVTTDVCGCEGEKP